MKIVQISDLHFTKLTYNPLHLLSKRVLGHFNWLFRRKAKISEAPLQSLPKFLQELQTELILINGDFTTTSLPTEFITAREFVKRLPAPWIGVPGNHDHYTYRAYQSNRYYRYLTPTRTADYWALGREGVEVHHLTKHQWLIAIDTARATNFFSSRGMFSKRVEKKLRHILALIPPQDQIFLFTHYPFLQNDSPRRRLSRADTLETIIRADARIKLYLHGHTHRQTIADLQPSKLPLILDPGCIANEETGSFHCLDLKENGLTVQLYRWEGKKWTQTREEGFEWTR